MNGSEAVEIIKTEVIGRAIAQRGHWKGRCWLALHRRTVLSKGEEHDYFFVTRGEDVPASSQKKPDAVVAIGFVGEGEDTKMVITDEYRLPIDCREYGSVAGLIDKADYEGSSNIKDAALRAAIREFYEETGLNFVPCEVSTPNLYCSAGLTNESICIVVGKASGTPSKEYLETHEDINTLMLNRDEIIALMDTDGFVCSKHVWPFLWAVKQFGFPTNLKPLSLN